MNIHIFICLKISVNEDVISSIDSVGVMSVMVPVTDQVRESDSESQSLLRRFLVSRVVVYGGSLSSLF